MTTRILVTQGASRLLPLHLSFRSFECLIKLNRTARIATLSMLVMCNHENFRIPVPLYTRTSPRIRNQPKSCGIPICLTVVSFRVEIPQGTYFISHIMAWLVSNKWHLFINLSPQQRQFRRWYMAKPLPNDVHPIWTQMVGVCSMRCLCWPELCVCAPSNHRTNIDASSFPSHLSPHILTASV